MFSCIQFPVFLAAMRITVTRYKTLLAQSFSVFLRSKSHGYCPRNSSWRSSSWIPRNSLFSTSTITPPSRNPLPNPHPLRIRCWAVVPRTATEGRLIRILRPTGTAPTICGPRSQSRRDIPLLKHTALASRSHRRRRWRNSAPPLMRRRHRRRPLVAERRRRRLRSKSAPSTPEPTSWVCSRETSTCSRSARSCWPSWSTSRCCFSE